LLQRHDKNAAHTFFYQRPFPRRVAHSDNTTTQHRAIVWCCVVCVCVCVCVCFSTKMVEGLRPCAHTAHWQSVTQFDYFLFLLPQPLGIVGQMVCIRHPPLQRLHPRAECRPLVLFCTICFGTNITRELRRTGPPRHHNNVTSCK